MSGKDRVELEALQQLGCLGGARFVDELAIRHRQRVGGVDRATHLDATFTFVQRLDAVGLLREIRKVEEALHGAHQHLDAVYGQSVDELNGSSECLGIGGITQRDALLIGSLTHGGGTGVILIGGNHICEQLVESIANLLVVLFQNLVLKA